MMASDKLAMMDEGALVLASAKGIASPAASTLRPGDLALQPLEGNVDYRQDPNLANPHLLVNRDCIYERHLPGGAYITAHAQRLQHGYYSSRELSDRDLDNVDFLAIDFVFHCPNAAGHRFKAATIRVSVRGSREMATSVHYPHGLPPGNPRFLMHAPHLMYGAVSPETMQWTFSLAGSLGISEIPFNANVTPSGSVYSTYRHYEMTKIQGSVRTLKSKRGRAFDTCGGEVFWSLEENKLQKSGVPRKFTFAVLIQKPSAESRIDLSIEVDPIIQSWFGSYPHWWLSLPKYQAVQRKTLDFKRAIGQHFEPAVPGRGFNFANLVSVFDEFVRMPGRYSATVYPQPHFDRQPPQIYPGRHPVVDGRNTQETYEERRSAEPVVQLALTERLMPIVTVDVAQQTEADTMDHSLSLEICASRPLPSGRAARKETQGQSIERRRSVRRTRGSEALNELWNLHANPVKGNAPKVLPLTSKPTNT